MFDFNTPIWLLGILSVPIIRLLHRYSLNNKLIAVTSLSIWPRQETTANSEPHRNKPDRIWLLRAAVVSILFISLAQPIWNTPSDSITIWIDNSPSMYVKESGITRIENAITNLIATLHGQQNGNIHVHTLFDPDNEISLDATQSVSENIRMLTNWTKSSTQTLALPAVSSLDENTTHWLVTDGADARLDAWLRKAPITKIINTGSETENVGISEIVTRPSLSKEDTSKLAVKIVNYGQREAERLLRVTHNNVELDKRRISIPVNGINVQDFEILNTDSNKNHTVSLIPSDAFTPDDVGEIIVQTDKLRMFVSRICSKKLAFDLSNLRGVILQQDRNKPHDLHISCAGQAGNSAKPGIVFHSGKQSFPAEGIPLWSDTTGGVPHIFIDSSWLRGLILELPQNHINILSTTNNMPLVTRSIYEKNIMHVWIDIESSPLRQRPEYPILLATLIELASHKRIFDNIVNVPTLESESRISPQSLAVSGRTDNIQKQNSTNKLDGFLLGMAILLLIIDLFVFYKRITVKYLYG